ncbi:aminopeptidase P family protein [Pelagibacterales bacterium SAG-MED20]|nr:aminopeptidase P family protein [Pelagibacterales bacterium SAG-MED20]
MIEKKIQILRKKFKTYNIDGYIIPKNDEFFSEYAVKDRLKLISNFNGSAGIAIILKKKNYLFVDGRYTIQAKQQSGKQFKIIEIHKFLPKKIIKTLKLGFDPSLFTQKNLNINFGNSVELVSIKNNLIDEIHQSKKIKQKIFYSLNNDSVGESYQSKINKISNILKVKKADYLFVSSPENVAWLMNIRGFDSPTSPIPNSRLIINKNKKIFFIVEEKSVSKIIKEKKIKKNQIVHPNEFENLIRNLKGNKFIIDSLSCSILNEEIIKSNFKIIAKNDPCYELKSVKNSTEIKNTIRAHVEDGLALTKFIYWIKKVNKKKITEIDAKSKLQKFRKLSKNYLFPSFDTIAGAGSNGAIVHYRVSKKSNKIINKKDIFLCDSGGQYKYGTTDVTRTICFSKQKKSIKDIFTKVLKGHIAVYLTNLKKDNTGKKIDLRARKFLKKDGLDYAHGTGHGVGFFLNVHEGPQSISKFNSIKLKEGMILSNEPGYYRKGQFGIRIENLLFIKKNKQNLCFQNLTLAPIEKDLINYNLLTVDEKDYLFRYHLKIYTTYSKFLNLNERKWLASLI